MHQTARKRGCAQIKSYAKERSDQRACKVIKQFGIAMPHAKNTAASHRYVKPHAFRNSSTRSVHSQVNSGSSRPKCPYDAVLR